VESVQQAAADLTSAILIGALEVRRSHGLDLEHRALEAARVRELRDAITSLFAQHYRGD
jgi:hypothetical protein